MGGQVTYDESEQDVLMHVFMEMLWQATGDGGTKRAAGLKPPWWSDDAHMPAVWSHFRKHEMGELVDPESKAHPFVHAAWRLLAVAYQETYGKVDPAEMEEPVLYHEAEVDREFGTWDCD